MMKKSLWALWKIIMLAFFVSCGDDDSTDSTIGNDAGVPDLLYGMWRGEDSRGQSLSLLLERDGSCTYKRSHYVDEDGIFTYDPEEKRITTTIEEIGSGAVVYIVEMLTEDTLVVKLPKSETRLVYTRDKDYEG